MENLLVAMDSNGGIFMAGALFISLISLIIAIVCLIRSGKVIRNYRSMMTGMEGKNLEEVMTSHVKTVNKIFSKTLEIESEYKATKKMAERSLQKLGVVRFNAFDNTGSDLSFAIALLDYSNDGLVISGLFGRDETRTYAKPIKGGVSTYHLSDEEAEAIQIAMNQQGSK